MVGRGSIHDGKLTREAEVNIAMRWFIGYGLHEKLPHKCPRGKALRPGNPVGHGRFLYARKRDCQRCSLASICVSKGRTSKGIVISHDYPALLRARRRRER
jgi:hypothetical protein